MNKIFLTLFVFIISCSTNDGEPQYPYGIIRPSENAESFGCGNVFVYQFIDSKMAITLRIKSSLVNLSQENQTLTLNDDSDKFVVTIEEAGNSPDSIYFNYCNDVRFHNQGVLKRYNASRGTITFSVSENNPIKDPIWETNYNISIEACDLEFIDNSGNVKFAVDKIVFWDVHVGWMPG